MELEFLTSVVTDRASYQRGDRTTWSDRADAQRLIKAGYAREVKTEPRRN